jgi:hypothetical protein
MPPPVPANQRMTVTLEAQQWNGVLAALAEAPYRVAAPLIQVMTEQLQQQSSGSGGPTLNGLDQAGGMPS